MSKTVTAEQRFWNKVDQSAGPANCWPWLGFRNPHQYGRLKFGGHIRQSHRVAWELANGRPIPDGMVILHSCDNPACVNPAHLSAGTPAENSADCKAKGRTCRGEANPKAKLTPDLVREIREEYGTGAGPTLHELAAKYNVGHVTIWNAVRRVNWGFVQ